MTTSLTSVTTSPATAKLAKTPDDHRETLRKTLARHLNRLQASTGLTLDEIARHRLGWSRGNHFSQLTLPKYKSVLSPATAIPMAKALELDDDESDELFILTMRANSDRHCQITPDFLVRYDKALVRGLCRAATRRGIRLS